MEAAVPKYGGNFLADFVLLASRPTDEDLFKYCASYIAASGQTVNLPVTHRFLPGGIYLRELHVPKGVWIVSARHKTKNQLIILKGKVSFRDSFKKDPIHVIAPYFYVTEAGTRKILYHHEDTTYLTIHRTDKTDPDEILKDLVYEEDMDFPADNPNLLSNTVKEI